MENIPSRPRGGVPPSLPPRKPSQLSQLSQLQHIVHGACQAKYNCSCGDSDKANVCNCSVCYKSLGKDNSPCFYYGRCVEPLAWNIEHEPIKNQTQSPFLTLLPRELRDLIFEYALIDCEADSTHGIFRWHESKFRIRPNSPRHDIAVNLLRTCRAIYLETWTLPLSLNPYIIYDLNDPSRFGIKLHELLPWQFALIQRLDVSLQQFALEGNTLHHYLHNSSRWQPELRHTGVYVVPRRYKTPKGRYAMVEFPAAFNCSLVPTHGKLQPRHFLSHIFGIHQHHPEDSHPPWSSAMRVVVAKPLTHLTLRLQHTNWWNWASHPDSLHDYPSLNLSPVIGTGGVDNNGRPTQHMHALAESQHTGHVPAAAAPERGWLRTISALPDLKRLDLVLETFKAKERQLEGVVEAAKTWRFPLTGTHWELIWDREVEMTGWSVGADEWQERRDTAWHEMAKEFSVRRIGFIRRRVV